MCVSAIEKTNREGEMTVAGMRECYQTGALLDLLVGERWLDDEIGCTKEGHSIAMR